MILLDEQFAESQRQLLRSWHVPVRQIGVDVGRKGMKDDEIPALLLQLRRPTFFTLDFGFFRAHLCHQRYCLVYIDAHEYEAASFARRLLQHPDFDCEADRMGAVVRVSHTGLAVWRAHAQVEQRLDWPAAG